MAFYYNHRNLDDIFKSSLGYVSWNVYPISTPSTANAVTSQTIYAMAVPYRAGQVVTEIVYSLSVAAAGTAPTGIYVGLASTTTVLMDSANLKDNADFTAAGLKSFPLSSAKTIPSDGIYYHLLLINGTFGSTQPTFNRLAATGAANPNDATKFHYATGGTGQATLPAVDAAITLAASGTPLPLITASV